MKTKATETLPRPSVFEYPPFAADPESPHQFLLPTRGLADYALLGRWQALGIQIGDLHKAITYTHVTLPEGWTHAVTQTLIRHRISLHDARGRERVRVDVYNYAAASGPTGHVHTPLRRYIVGTGPDHAARGMMGAVQYVVHDRGASEEEGRFAYIANRRAGLGRWASEAEDARLECEQWLALNAPEHANPLAYWEL